MGWGSLLAGGGQAYGGLLAGGGQACGVRGGSLLEEDRPVV